MDIITYILAKGYTDNAIINSEDLKGSGIYIGSGDMPKEYDVQIDPEGEGIEVYSKTEIDEMLADLGGDGESGLPSTTIPDDIKKLLSVDAAGSYHLVPITEWGEEIKEVVKDKAQWVKLGTYDLTLPENQVERITINEYNGAPFTIHKAFIYSENVTQTGSYYVVGNELGAMQIGLKGAKTYSFIFPDVVGTRAQGLTSGTHYTGVATASTTQPYATVAFFPSDSIYVRARNATFASGTIEVWGYIEQ